MPFSRIFPEEREFLGADFGRAQRRGGMFEKTLVKGAKDNLALLGKSGLLQDAYLAGGTAAALWLGHRISVDLDFFIPKEFNPRQVATQLSKLGRFEEEKTDKGTIGGRFQGIKFSLFEYTYPLVAATKSYLSLNVADLKDIGAMKIDAISSRGARRDFIDLYFICQAGYKLRELLNWV